MSYASRVLIVLSLPLAILASACSRGPEQSTQQSAPAAAPAQPAAATESPDVKKDMHAHFDQVRAIEEAVVRGDLDAAKAPAQALASHTAPGSLPAENVTAMKNAAQTIANATDIKAAAAGAAALVAACGDCHAASKVTPTLPPPVIYASTTGAKGHMAEHQQAVDQLYRSLVTNSDEEWKKGATALAAAPLGGKDLPQQVTKEAASAEATVHELASKAVNATDRQARVTVYSEVIGSCASCHGIHGKVWGPGVPKAE